MITRRQSLLLLGAWMASVPFASRAQPARKVPRLGILHPASVEASTVYKVLVAGLADRGFVEGRNIAFELRSGNGDQTFAALGGERPDAVVVMQDTFFGANAARIAELAHAQRLPVFSGGRAFTEAGFLASYGSDARAVSQRAAAYVQKILTGAKPGDLAVELPTKFELVINAKTAKALGVDVPASVLARADEVIR